MNINNERINQILTQTNYTETEAIVKLQAHNGDAIEVIREYMGLKPRATTEKKQIKSQELNQEIFRQIRKTMDKSMREYREKNPIDMQQVSENLKESDRREEIKREERRKKESI